MPILQKSRNVERKTVIIIENDEHVECWGSLKRLCDPDNGHSNFSYHFLKRKKFPFLYKGWKFYKVRFSERQFYAKGKFKDYTNQ
jgi:hypothetical protein